MNIISESELLIFCISKKLFGVAKLVQALQTRENSTVKLIFSSTVGLAKIDKTKYITPSEIEAVIFSLPSIQWGNRNGQDRPMNHLLHLPSSYEKLTTEQISSFDEVCHDFAVVLEGVHPFVFKSIGSASVLRDRSLPSLS